MRSGRVLGVAGWQGAGKTTLLAAAVEALMARGVSVAVLARAHHPVAVDPRGTDSDRLFQAGADVLLSGDAEGLARWRPREETADAATLAGALLRSHDLVLLEGWKAAPHPKVWLLRPGECDPPPGIPGVELVLRWGEDRLATLLPWIESRLAAAWEAQERRAGVLVGGGSRRMGRPKAELRIGGVSLLARSAAALAGVGSLTLLGSWNRGEGAESPPLEAPSMLPDAPGVVGPLGGLLSALRWAPVTWVVAACDLPLVERAAVDWLLEQRAPGRWAILPRVAGEVQPLLAVYEPQSLPLLEALLRGGTPAPSRLQGHPRVATPEPPPHLAAAWRGVNTPAELAALLDETGSASG